MRRAVLVLALLVLAATAHRAAAQMPVDVAIVLAVDASGSVDQARFELQKQGYAAAFRAPEVLRAIGSGPHRAIAVTMVQWTGPALHEQVVGWRVLSDAASPVAFAAAIDAAPRALFGGGTSLVRRDRLWQDAVPHPPFRADRQVIDISGDGSNNRGRPAAEARDEAVAAGIAINGLPILTLEPDLDHWYEENVIGGPGAFVIAGAQLRRFRRRHPEEARARDRRRGAHRAPGRRTGPSAGPSTFHGSIQTRRSATFGKACTPAAPPSATLPATTPSATTACAISGCAPKVMAAFS